MYIFQVFISTEGRAGNRRAGGMGRIDATH